TCALPIYAAELDPVGGTDGLDAECQGGLGISPPQGDDPLRIGGDIDGSEFRVDAGPRRVGRFGVASAAAGEDEEGGEDRGEYSAHDFLFTSLGEPSLTHLHPSGAHSHEGTAGNQKNDSGRDELGGANGRRPAMGAVSHRSGRSPNVSSRRECRAV